MFKLPWFGGYIYIYIHIYTHVAFEHSIEAVSAMLINNMTWIDSNILQLKKICPRLGRHKMQSHIQYTRRENREIHRTRI